MPSPVEMDAGLGITLEGRNSSFQGKAYERQEQSLGPIPGAASHLGIDPHAYNIWIRTFGALRVYINYQEVPPSAWPYPKVRSLLRLLLLHDGFLPLDYVLDTIWPNLTPERARQNFSVALHHLRRILEPDMTKHHSSQLLIYKNQQIRFNHGKVLSDRNLFLALAREAESLKNNPDKYAQTLDHMIRLYAGPLFEEEVYEDWCIRERDHLQDMFLLAHQELAQYCLEQGNFMGCLRHAKSVLSIDPLRESVHSLLMRAYRAMGHRARAVSHYHRLRRTLNEELGVEPSSEINAIYADLLED